MCTYIATGYTDGVNVWAFFRDRNCIILSSMGYCLAAGPLQNIHKYMAKLHKDTYGFALLSAKHAHY